MVYKVLLRNMLPIKPGTPGRTPSLFRQCTVLFCVRIHNTQDQLTSHFIRTLCKKKKKASLKPLRKTKYQVSPHGMWMARGFQLPQTAWCTPVTLSHRGSTLPSGAIRWCLQCGNWWWFQTSVKPRWGDLDPRGLWPPSDLHQRHRWCLVSAESIKSTLES